jgi:hypothetical protein
MPEPNCATDPPQLTGKVTLTGFPADRTYVRPKYPQLKAQACCIDLTPQAPSRSSTASPNWDLSRARQPLTLGTDGRLYVTFVDGGKDNADGAIVRVEP